MHFLKVFNMVAREKEKKKNELDKYELHLMYVKCNTFSALQTILFS